MPLPALNTSGIDIGNTLLKIRGLEQQDAVLARQARQDIEANALRKMQMQNLESEISARGTPEEQTARRETENALKVLQIKREKATQEETNLKLGRAVLARIDVDTFGLEDYDKAVDYVRNNIGEAQAANLPDRTIFQDADGSFVPDVFNKWRDRQIMTADEIMKGNKDFEKVTLYNTDTGATLLDFVKKGQKLDPIKTYGKGWSLEKPQYEKDTINDFTTFYKAGKTEGKTDRQISNEWETKKIRIAQASKTPEKPEMKPGQALDKLARIEAAIATIKRKETISLSTAIMFPEMAALAGKKLNPEESASAIAAFERQRDYVKEFAPEDKKPAKPAKEVSIDIDTQIKAQFPKAIKTGKKDPVTGKDVWQIGTEEGTF